MKIDMTAGCKYIVLGILRGRSQLSTFMKAYREYAF